MSYINMKKNFYFLFCLLFLLALPSVLFAVENEVASSSEGMVSYTLEIADKISTFSLKGKIFFMFTNEESDVIEISPVRSDVCRMIVAVPQGRAAGFENYTVYLRKNDLVLFQRGSKTYGGYVKDFDFNQVFFAGKISE